MTEKSQRRMGDVVHRREKGVERVEEEVISREVIIVNELV